jgi:hypothetical protein
VGQEKSPEKISGLMRYLRRLGSKNFLTFFVVYDNGLGLGEGGVLKAQSLNLAQRYIKCTNVRFSTSAPLLAIPC